MSCSIHQAFPTNGPEHGYPEAANQCRARPARQSLRQGRAASDSFVDATDPANRCSFSRMHPHFYSIRINFDCGFPFRGRFATVAYTGINRNLLHRKAGFPTGDQEFEVDQVVIPGEIQEAFELSGKDFGCAIDVAPRHPEQQSALEVIQRRTELSKARSANALGFGNGIRRDQGGQNDHDQLLGRGSGGIRVADQFATGRLDSQIHGQPPAAFFTFNQLDSGVFMA